MAGFPVNQTTQGATCLMSLQTDLVTLKAKQLLILTTSLGWT